MVICLTTCEKLLFSFPGQLEKTISQSFTRSANLRAFAYKPNQCPRAILDCQPIFGRLIDPRLRNTLSSDIASFRSVLDEQEAESEWMWNPRAAKKISADVREAFLRCNLLVRGDKAQFLSHLSLRGLRYTNSQAHFGNSCVLLKHGQTSSAFPAIIQSIFKMPISTESVGTFIAARRYKSLSRPFDNQPHYPVLELTFWDSDLGDLEVFEIKHIHAHFASLSFEHQGILQGRPVVSVISLSRVSFFRTMRSSLTNCKTRYHRHLTNRWS